MATYESEYTKCLTQTEFYFCSPIPYGFIIIFASLAALNIVIWLITRLTKVIYLPFYVLLMNLTQNLLFSFLVTSITCLSVGSTNIIYIVLIPSSIIFTGFLSFLFSIKISVFRHKLTDIARVRSLMFEKYFERFIFKSSSEKDLRVQSCFINSEDCEKMYNYMFFNPPLITIQPDIDEIQKISYGNIFLPQRELIKYGSWEPEGERPFVDESRNNILQIKNEVRISEELYEEINSKIVEMKQKVANQIALFQGFNNFNSVMKYIVDVNMETIVYGVPSVISLSPRSHYLRFLNSTFGQIIYGIFHQIGLSIIFDNIFILSASIQEVSTKRIISHTTDLTNPMYKGDASGISADCLIIEQNNSQQSQLEEQRRIMNEIQMRLSMEQIFNNESDLTKSPYGSIHESPPVSISTANEHIEISWQPGMPDISPYS